MSLIYDLIISPIVAIVDWVFLFIHNKFPCMGIIGAVIGVSLVINFLALPLYNIADKLQEKEREKVKLLEPRIKRIKKAFKGTEQFMMLSEYYRQNNYHPVYALRSALTILIEIPFFIAAYQYLSHNSVLSSGGWWIFNNLGKADNLLTFNTSFLTLPINVLPIIMTLINVISSAIYTKNYPLRDKIQQYALALLFLILLYDSASGLVIYWILNNIFSLLKNIVIKKKHSKLITYYILWILLVCFNIYEFFHCDSQKKLVLFTILVFFSAFIPVLIKHFKSLIIAKINFNIRNKITFEKNVHLFIVSCFGLACLLGLLIPASVINSSPAEFSFLGKTTNPLSYIKTSLLFFVGLFILWPSIIYCLFGDSTKRIMTFIFPLTFILTICNIFIFNFDYGNLSTSFVISNTDSLNNYSPIYKICPILIALIISAVFFLLNKYNKQKILTYTIFSLFSGILALGIVKSTSVQQVYSSLKINKEVQNIIKGDNTEIEKIYHLSKTDPNVIVLFMDRAISEYFEQTMENDSAIKSKFDGFIFYPNTLTLSNSTTTGTPGLMGGYEYSPEGMNSRDDIPLRIKHNEATMIMPKLFYDAGFSSTITDPPWSNYKHEPDLTPFDDFPQFKAYTTIGKYTNLLYKELNISDGVSNNIADIVCKKEIRNFSVLQAIYPPLRNVFYNKCLDRDRTDLKGFYNSFSSLYYLPQQIDFDSQTPSFCFIDNETTHEEVMLDKDLLHSAESTSGTNEDKHYITNYAALNQIAKLLDFLRENNVYNNTRIIIVSDHGTELNLTKFADFKNGGKDLQSHFNCLLVFKDFNSNEPLKVDNTLMTNADTLFLAKKGLPISNINPFTQNEFHQKKENGVIVYQYAKGDNKANQLTKATTFTINDNLGWHVKDNIFNKNNWTSLEAYKHE